MNREDCIKAIYDAERSKNTAESFRLFGMGLVSSRVYQQIKREAQGRGSDAKGQDHIVAVVSDSRVALAARPPHGEDEAQE